MVRSFLAAILLLAPLTVLSAQDKTAEEQPPQRIRNVTIVGDQKCPKATGDEVVVCSRINPDEQYRIPKQLRKPVPSPANNSWVNRANDDAQIGRVAGGLPETCSPIGAGGQTGCAAKAFRDARAERKERQKENAEIP